MDKARLRRIGQRQLGLYTRAQAIACGASAYQIRRRLQAGEWQLVIGTVLAPADLPITARIRDLAAALAVPGGVLAGPSAARAWSIPVADERVYLAVGRDRHPAVAGVRYLRTHVDPADVTTWGRALITSRERAVIDCLLVLSEPRASDLLDTALHRGWLTLDALTARTRAHAGRHGARRLVRLMRARVDCTRSAAERRCARLLRDARVTGWQANVPVHDARGLIGVADFLFAAARLIIEVDGLAFHSAGPQFQRDRERQNRLVAAGWTVLRFTWTDLTERPEYVIATVCAMLAK